MPIKNQGDAHMFQAVEAHSNLAPPLSYDLVSRQLAIPPTKIDHRDRCTTLVHYLQTTSNQHVHNSSPLDHHQCLIVLPQSSPHSRLLTNGDRDGPLSSQKEIIIENITVSQPPAPPSTELHHQSLRALWCNVTADIINDTGRRSG